YGDTLSSLAIKKYGHAVPIEALYAANNLPPRFEQDANGCVIAREPIYYAGRKYVLPPADQIQALARAYEQKYFRR
ncbi:MAG TPA: LysM peptidoglycan-binding domain-containing protein, partial [Candidatus Melainabacteria bacterium]|nr:LysM peptidoglycan-binding domain-containing protein [Candidatus Melainabacteria bacterium]